jgi:hypothetical protein
LRITRPARFAIAVVGVALLVAAGCGKDDKSESSTTTTQASTATTTGGGTVRVVVVNKAVQQELADVGCYSGAIDGVFGPETDAAILAFQAGDGLTVDGELGPETKAALAEAVAKKQKVCTSSGTTVPPTSTTAPAAAPCTATALAKALPSGTEITNYACSEGYAGVAGTSGGKDTTALLQAEGSTWKDLGTNACGGASAGYPPAVLEIACPA